VTGGSVPCPVMWEGSVLRRVPGEPQILRLVTFWEGDVSLVQVCAGEWSSRCTQPWFVPAGKDEMTQKCF